MSKCDDTFITIAFQKKCEFDRHKKIFPKAQRIRELMLVIAIAFLNIIFSIRNNAHNFLEGIFFSRITSQVNSSQWVSSWQDQAMIGLESDKDDLCSSYIRVQLYICCPAVSGQNSGSWRAHAWKGLVFDVTVVLSGFFLIDASKYRSYYQHNVETTPPAILL